MHDAPGSSAEQAPRPRAGDGGAGAPECRPSRMERAARAATQFVTSSPALWIASFLAGGLVISGVDYFEQLIDGLSFLLLILLQRSQSKDTTALQLKLDELVASSPRASNRVLNAEDISEEELARIHRHFALLDRLSRQSEEPQLTEEDAYRRHEEEQQARMRSDPAQEDG